MKNVILKCLLLGTLLAAFYFGGQYILSLNYVDEYYYKFTYPAGSLILGISRANDGVVPEILEREVDRNMIETPVLNFAFHLSQSPYGPVYYEAIKKKVPAKTRKGIFILSVTPGALSIPAYLEDDPKTFSDRFSILHKVDDVNTAPNFEYMRKVYGKALYKAFLDPDLGIRTVHYDGWMEVDVNAPGFNISDKHTQKWKKEIIDSYKGFEGFYKFSNTRFNSLEETIRFLKKHGQVILIRIPVDPEILSLEHQFMPDFDDLMAQLSQRNKIPYLNYNTTGKRYETYDGAHLSKTGAIQFTQDLARDINSLLSPDLYVKTSIH